MARFTLIGGSLGTIDLLDHVQPFTGQGLEKTFDYGEALFRAVRGDQADCRHGPGIDQGIDGSGLQQFQGQDGVERQAGGFQTDFFGNDLFITILLDDQARGERLGNGLDRKGMVRIADSEYLAVSRDQSQTEQFRVHLGQLWDVIGIGPLGIAHKQGMGLLKNLQEDVRINTGPGPGRVCGKQQNCKNNGHPAQGGHGGGARSDFHEVACMRLPLGWSA